MSVDVEEYFQVWALSSRISRSEWTTFESRVDESTNKVLDLFEEKGATATFLVLGSIAQRHRKLVRDIVARGHELASHGFAHRRVREDEPEDCYQNVLRPGVFFPRCFFEALVDTSRSSARTPRRSTSGTVSPQRYRLADGETWIRTESGAEPLAVEGLPSAVLREQLSSPRLGSRRLVLWWYWIGGQFMSSAWHAKAVQVRDRLLGRATPAAIVAVSSRFGTPAMQACALCER